MNDISLRVMPDLTVDVCPLGCDEKCDKLWINKQTSHRIVCLCTCHQKKDKASEVEPPATNALKSSPIGAAKNDNFV